MGYLALRISKFKEVDATPLTNLTGHFDCFMEIKKASMQLRRVGEIKTKLLEGLFPFPETNFDDKEYLKEFIQDIRMFKDDHSVLLKRFRDWVQRTTLRLCLEEDETERDTILGQEKDKLAEYVDHLTDEIKAKGWRVKSGKIISKISDFDITGTIGTVHKLMEHAGVFEDFIDEENEFAAYPAAYVAAFENRLNGE